MAMKKICIAGIATAAAAASVPLVAHADSVFGFSSSSSSSGSNSDFNPETLERAAKALREINKSKNAKNVFEVMRQQEETRQLELEVQRLHQELMETRRDMERQRAIFEEQRKMYQTRAQEKAQNLQGEDDLARKRMQHDIETQKRQDRELVKMQEESYFRQEQMKCETEEQIQAQLHQTEKERAQFERETLRGKAMAEAEGRVRQAKLSEDVNRRILLERVNAEREKWLSAINTTFEHIGDGVNALLTDRNKLLIAVGGATALAAGVYTTREGSRVMWGYVDRILGQPTLLRESSRGKYPWSGLLSRSISTKSKVTDSTALKGTTSNGNGNGFGEVILHPSLKKRIEHLAKATANTKSHKAPFRNMLFFGPPGTGKTMAARELAQKSGLEYAMMTGGDVVPLGSQAVTKIHQLFDWAGKSKKGLLLFIDEADAFLCERNSTQMSEAQRSALNALLFRTGDQSRDIVLVCATNRPGDLDAAVTDRIDEILEFPLPGEEERFKLLKLYFNKYIVESGEKKTGLKALFDSKQQKIEVKDFSDDILWEAAKKTEGLSGREIAKMMAGVQAAVYGSKDCVLDANLFREVVDYKISEHHQRRKLAEGET